MRATKVAGIAASVALATASCDLRPQTQHTEYAPSPMRGDDHAAERRRIENREKYEKLLDEQSAKRAELEREARAMVLGYLAGKIQKVGRSVTVELRVSPEGYIVDAEIDTSATFEPKERVIELHLEQWTVRSKTGREEILKLELTPEEILRLRNRIHKAPKRYQISEMIPRPNKAPTKK